MKKMSRFCLTFTDLLSCILPSRYLQKFSISHNPFSEGTSLAVAPSNRPSCTSFEFLLQTKENDQSGKVRRVESVAMFLDPQSSPHTDWGYPVSAFGNLERTEY